MFDQVLYFLICSFSAGTLLFAYLAYKERGKYKSQRLR